MKSLHCLAYNNAIIIIIIIILTTTGSALNCMELSNHANRAYCGDYYFTMTSIVHYFACISVHFHQPIQPSK